MRWQKATDDLTVRGAGVRVSPEPCGPRRPSQRERERAMVIGKAPPPLTGLDTMRGAIDIINTSANYEKLKEG